MNLSPQAGQVETPSDDDALGAFRMPITIDGDAIIAQATAPDKEPDPEVDDSFDPVVTLPVGLLDHAAHGTVRTAEVRELTGFDEEDLARISRDTPWRYQQAIVAAGVKSFGPGDKRTTDVVGDLTMGDLNFLTMMVRVATFGKDIDYDIVCPKCKSQQAVTFYLPDDVPTLDAPAPESRVTLRSGAVATVIPPTVTAQAKVLEAALQRKATDAESNTILLGETVLHINDGRVWMGEESARALGIKDRILLLETILGAQGGPDLSNVPVDCGACGHTLNVAIDLTDLFR